MAGSLVASAQSLGELKSQFGIRLGIDVNIPSKMTNLAGKSDMFKPGAGVSVGGFYNIQLGKRFFLEPGVSFYYDRYSYKDLGIMSNDQIVDTDPGIGKFGFRIPVVAGYSIGLTETTSLSLFTGPEVSIAVGGKYIYKHPDEHDGLGLDMFEENRRVDCAWKIGAGLRVNDFQINLDGAIGMVDIAKSDLQKYHENRITIGASYFF